MKGSANVLTQDQVSANRSDQRVSGLFAGRPLCGDEVLAGAGNPCVTAIRRIFPVRHIKIHVAILALLLTSGCALRAPLVTPGQTILAVWGFTEGGASLREALTVDADLGNGWLLVHSPGETQQWTVNMQQMLQFTTIPALPHPATGWDDAIRERVSR